jgi:tetratricopeptide (TPR) repeat protein
MSRFRHIGGLFLLLAALPAGAQICDSRSPLTAVQIQLMFGDDASDVMLSNHDTAQHSDNAGARKQTFDSSSDIRVQVSEQLGGVVAENAPTAEGKVVVNLCKNNRYTLRVTGSTIQEVTIDSIQPNRGDRLITIVLHPKLTKEQQKAREAAVSAKRLGVPRKAVKELEKGNRAWKDGKVEKARAHFEKAIAIYPQFDEAQNALGLLLIRENQREAARAAFSHAIEANPKYAPALINLAKLEFDAKQYANAARLAQQALATEPLSPPGLFVAAEATFFAKRYAETVSYAKTLHTLPHSQYALAHYLAAKALESQGQIADAALEYQTFVDEDPSDPNATRARELLALLQRVLAGPQAAKPQDN